MLTHVDTAIRVSLILAASLAAMPLLRGRSASSRRLLLSVAFVASLVLSFAPKRVSAVHVEAPVAYRELTARVIAEPAVAGEAPAPKPKTGAPNVIALLWLAGALAVGARFAVGFAIAALHARRAKRTREWNSHIEVRISDSIGAPAVAGLVAPVILVPASSKEWSEARRRAVLLHEEAHVKAQDVRVQLVAAIVCSLHWFNPLAWLAARRLRFERELAADESVLRAGVRASAYAEDLLAIAAAAPFGMIAIGEKPLARRVAAIVAPHRGKRVGAAGQAVLVACACAATLAVACTDVSETPKPVVVATPLTTTTSTTHNELQTAVTNELQRTIETWHADGGAILVLTPKGEVLAEAGDPDRTIVAGSTMKPLLLAAALEEGVVRESDVFESAPVGELLAKSSNPGFTRIFERVGPEKLGRVLQGFRFALPPTLDANAAIGGTMPATPRQVAQAYAALANGGNGVVSARTALRVTSLMERVVTSSEGTGKKARVEGVRIAGKTGTSDWTAEGKQHGYASFVGFVPAENPRVVIYVGVESPRGANPWGGEVAAPVFARLAHVISSP